MLYRISLLSVLLIGAVPASAEFFNLDWLGQKDKMTPQGAPSSGSTYQPSQTSSTRGSISCDRVFNPFVNGQVYADSRASDDVCSPPPKVYPNITPTGPAKLNIDLIKDAKLWTALTHKESITDSTALIDAKTGSRMKPSTPANNPPPTIYEPEPTGFDYDPIGEAIRAGQTEFPTMKLSMAVSPGVPSRSWWELRLA